MDDRQPVQSDITIMKNKNPDLISVDPVYILCHSFLH
jgi:hypothetical protein